MSRCRAKGLLAVVVGACALSPLTVGTAAAAQDFTFVGLASAQAFDAQVTNGGIPILQTLEVGGPTGQAQLAGSGRAHALATAPNVGEVATLPGLLQSMGVPAPDYPLQVTADDGEKDGIVDKPGVHLLASASKMRVTGSAALGEGSASNSAVSTVVSSNRGITAMGVATSATMQIAPGVAISGVTGTATATRDAEGILTTTSSIHISTLTAAGLAFSLSDGKLTLAGQSIPVPFSQLQSLLLGAGVTASYQEPTRTKDGIIGANLTLKTALPGTPVTNSTTGTIVFGSASASVSYTTFDGYSQAGSGPAKPTPGTSGGLGGLGGLGGVAVPPSGGLTTQVGPGPPADPVPAPQATPENGAPGGSTASRTSAAAVQLPDILDIYLAIVIAALTALASAQAVRIMGARCAWSS